MQSEKYFVFAYNQHYGVGGSGDCKGIFNNFYKALARSIEYLDTLEDISIEFINDNNEFEQLAQNIRFADGYNCIANDKEIFFYKLNESIFYHTINEEMDRNKIDEVAYKLLLSRLKADAQKAQSENSRKRFEK